MARRQIEIDRDTLWSAVRTLGAEHVLCMLDAPSSFCPQPSCTKSSGSTSTRGDCAPAGRRRGRRLLADLKTFETASLAGDYYESFNVNSKNLTEKSRGTTGWIAECRRLLDRCVEQAKTADPADVCQAFGIIFGLLDRIDGGREDIIFFADEAGAWQVGVHWEKVLPPWFKILSATAAPEEYGLRIVGLLSQVFR